MEVVRNVHAELQYAVLAALVGGVVLALWWSSRDRAFQRGPFAVAMVVVDVQVLLGVVLWAGDGGWRLGALQGFLHPLLALAALGAGHAALGRARKAGDGPAAHRLVAVGFVVATALVLLAVVVAVAA